MVAATYDLSPTSVQDAAMANANMCQLLEEEAREKEREAREAARKLKRKLKKAEARLRSQEDEAASLRAQLAAAELDSSSGTSPDRSGATAADSTPEDTSPAKAPQPSVAAAAVADPDSPVAAAGGNQARRGKKKGTGMHGLAAELAGRQNGGPAAHARDSNAGQSAVGSDGDEEEARNEGALPDNWETMAEDEEEDGGGIGVSTDFNAVYGVSPHDSGSWTTVGLKKPAAAAPAEVPSSCSLLPSTLFDSFQRRVHHPCCLLNTVASRKSSSRTLLKSSPVVICRALKWTVATHVQPRHPLRPVQPQQWQSSRRGGRGCQPRSIQRPPHLRAPQSSCSRIGLARRPGAMGPPPRPVLPTGPACAPLLLPRTTLPTCLKPRSVLPSSLFSFSNSCCTRF